MTHNIYAIRGIKDVLPIETAIRKSIVDTLAQILSSYGYSEINLPIIEHTSLFKRAIGEATDVVEKEMYNFTDRNGNSLTLRPEGTAGCVRAVIEHNLLYNNYDQRLWYIGPMFRYERPQKGRYRQFYQLGVEAFGLYGPDIDAELITITARWWRQLGISTHVSLELNSIGSIESRARYCGDLVKFLEQHTEQLGSYKYRIYNNPLCILDSKNPNIQTILNDAPILNDYLDDESREHFLKLCRLLEIAGINYTINKRLVRGLDYYNRTVFEWITHSLGSQGSICAGGRYDNLVKQLGGNTTPAVGFATGIERLMLLVQAVNPIFKTKSSVDIYLIYSGVRTQFAAIKLAEQVRDELPKVQLITNYSGGNFKRQFTRANKFNARIALVIGESEMESGTIILKDLYIGKQITVTQDRVIEHLRMLLGSK